MFKLSSGLLPYGRGSGTVVGEIINERKFIGRTCHLMNNSFDSGIIVNQEVLGPQSLKI